MSHSLNDLLMLLNQVDDGMVMLSGEDMQTAIGDIKDKVDDLNYVKDKMESEIARLKGLEVEVKTKRQGIENSLKRLKEYVTYSLRNSETEILHGETHTLRVRKTKSEKLKNVVLDLDMVSYLERKYTGSVAYKLNSSILKPQLEDSDKEKFYERTESYTTSFKVRKK